MFISVCICINCIYVVLSYVGGNKESIYIYDIEFLIGFVLIYDKAAYTRKHFNRL